MSLTDRTCPECGTVLYTDDLEDKQCPSDDCGIELPDEMYEDVIEWYVPEEVNLDG